MRKEPDFTKCGGLLPTIVQDAFTGSVLMLGYMNREAYSLTLESGFVTFFSRSRNAIWRKGEISGNFLTLKELSCDCDRDAILVLAIPQGPTCHEGTQSCFERGFSHSSTTLESLASAVAERHRSPRAGSYTSSLFEKGIDAIVQKVGEEAIEVVIEGKNNDRNRLLNESADLLYHLMVLWEAKGISLNDVCSILRERSR